MTRRINFRIQPAPSILQRYCISSSLLPTIQANNLRRIFFARLILHELVFVDFAGFFKISDNLSPPSLSSIHENNSRKIFVEVFVSPVSVLKIIILLFNTLNYK